MVHNGIEYGVMASYAEGMNVLKNAGIGKSAQTVDAETTPLRDPEHYQYDFNLTDISEVWRHLRRQERVLQRSLGARR